MQNGKPTTENLTRISHRKSRQERDKDRNGPPYCRKLGRLDCSELSSFTLVSSLVGAGNTGGFSGTQRWRWVHQRRSRWYRRPSAVQVQWLGVKPDLGGCSAKGGSV